MAGGVVTPRRLAVVLAGGGARGAYEAGVLAGLLPQLEDAGIRPTLYIGTSAGAINACLFAAHAHLPAREQAEAVLAVWRGIGVGDVFRPVLRTAIPTTAQWAGQRLGWPGARLRSLVDTAPLRSTARERVPWATLRTNLDAGEAGLAVVATSAATGRSVVFVDDPTGPALPAADDQRPIDYVAAGVAVEHVLASAAIPVLFPPVQVTGPAQAAGWYADGGLRLNAPLKPAIALGADALLVVATHPAVAPAVGAQDGEHEPDVDDSIVAVIDAALVDPMVEDVRTLAKVNALVDGRRRQRSASGREYVKIPFVFVGPVTRGTLAAEAMLAYRDQFSGVRGAVRGLAQPDLPLLARMVCGDGDRRGDVLSYLLFDRGFVDRAVALGSEDAAKALANDPWHTTSLP
jgi:NTE family protein